jgi:signal transduction histidine kinase
VTPTRPGFRTLLIGAAVSVTYVLTATFGFGYAFVAEQVTTVWAPTGLAQAALLLGGLRLWPAVWLGAFAVNASTTAPLWTAIPIATGNTLEGVVAAWLLSRLAGFDPGLRQTRDTIAFIAVAAGVGPVISATIGVLTLCTAGVQAWASYWPLWFAWYLGDATGALIVGPVILTIVCGGPDRTRRSWAETAVMVGLTLVVMLAVFGQWIGPTVGHHPLEYVIFPLLIAAAVRLGQPATSLVVFCSAAIAIANTALGLGPFGDRAPHESLVLLQLFMAVVAGTGLLLAAAMTERETSERKRAAAHTRELDARREAEAANRAKDEFLATLSHELRTPLNAIVGWTRMLLDGTVDDAHRRRALEVIERNAQLQAQLVADILDVSGIITGGLKLNTATVDPVVVVGAAIDALRPAADARRLLITAHLPNEAPALRGDAQRLQQVVWNLVANAIKFTPPGGRVDVELRSDAGWISIVVRDTGAGIDPAFLPHVFDRFRQGDGSASRQHGGLGLGLAIVRHLVELHGGSVRAENSGTGRGAIFTVRLPGSTAAGNRTAHSLTT